MLLQKLFITSIFFLIAPTWAHAQHMNATDSPCADVVVTSDLSECLSNALKVADETLNKTYGRIQKALANRESIHGSVDSPRSADQKRLIAAQKLWIQFRDASCSAERELYGRGTAAWPAYLGCMGALTRQREADLNKGYGWIVQKFLE